MTDTPPLITRPRTTTRRAGLGLATLAAVACGPTTSPTATSDLSPSAQGTRVAPADLPPIFDRGGTITVQRGLHTVYHSDASLPTSTSPQPDGKATLVWFSQPG